MNKIILASHGELAQGMKQTVSMLIGTENQIYALSAFRDEDEKIDDQIQKLLKEIGTENVYILTDILGGSINNEMLYLLQQYPQLHVITGMNLPLVISLATQTGKIEQKVLARLIEESRAALVDCEQLLHKQVELGADDL
ncbi:PTS fructose transporter subunit IIA [Erwinia sp. CPCC 100877]|nr:PTS fructose transporter subunit IIA [Erwinia sp. CPCC 100877]